MSQNENTNMQNYVEVEGFPGEHAFTADELARQGYANPDQHPALYENRLAALTAEQENARDDDINAAALLLSHQAVKEQAELQDPEKVLVFHQGNLMTRAAFEDTAARRREGIAGN